MKNFRLKNTLFAIIFMSITVNCERGLYENENKKENGIIKNVSLNDTKSPYVNQEILKAVSIIKKKFEKSDLFHKNNFALDSINNFYFSGEDGKYIQQDEKISYTFPIYREINDGKVENIVFNKNPNNEYDVYLVKYNFDNQSLKNTSTESLVVQPAELTNLQNNRINIICVDVNFCTDAGELVGAGNSPIMACVWYTITCGNTDSGLSNSNESGGSSNSSSGAISTGNTPGAAGGPANLILTIPLSSIQEANKNFINSLNFTAQEMFTLLSPDIQNIVFDFMNLPQNNTLFVRNNIKNVINNLNLSWIVWQNQTIQNNIVNYLAQNNFSHQGLTFINNLIIEIKNTTRIALPTNTILVSPLSNQYKINDINEYLKCFDNNSSAVFTIYVDQPTANSNTAWSGNPANPDVGHTFIAISQNGIRRVLGFYPSAAVSLDNPSTIGICANDGNHQFDTSLTTVINPTQLTVLLNFIKNKANAPYNLNTFNCTDFGMNCANLINMSLASAYGTWGNSITGTGGGDNPGQLGQNIRNMPINNAILRTTTPSFSAPNNGICP